MMFYAEKGGGAFLNGRSIRVSGRESLTGGVVCTAAFSRLSKMGYAPGYLKIAEKTLATRNWQDAYGHMLVACGRVEAMFDPIVTRWDISAVIPIIEEAGGRCTRADGKPWWEETDDEGHYQVLSSNRLVHDELLGDLALS